MNHLLIPLLLASGAPSAQSLRLASPPPARVLLAPAQPAAFAAPLPAAAAAPDTIAALHRLFAARRQRRNIIAGSAVGAALVGTAATPADGFFSTGDYAKLYGIGAAAVIAADFVFSLDYSQKNEQRAIESFQAHQLSRHLTRQLKARYFR